MLQSFGAGRSLVHYAFKRGGVSRMCPKKKPTMGNRESSNLATEHFGGARGRGNRHSDGDADRPHGNSIKSRMIGSNVNDSGAAYHNS